MDAFFLHPVNLHAALDSYVIFLCLQAVVLAARHTKLKFVWQLTAKIMCIQFLRKSIGVNTSAGTDFCTLTGCDRADSRTADTRIHTAIGQLLPHLLNIIKMNEWNLNALSGGHMYISMTVLFRYLRYRLNVFRCQISSHYLQAQ